MEKSLELRGYVEIIVDELPVPVTVEESKDPNIADIVRARRVGMRIGGDAEAAEEAEANAVYED